MCDRSILDKRGGGCSPVCQWPLLLPLSGPAFWLDPRISLSRAPESDCFHRRKAAHPRQIFSAPEAYLERNSHKTLRGYLHSSASRDILRRSVLFCRSSVAHSFGDRSDSTVGAILRIF